MAEQYQNQKLTLARTHSGVERTTIKDACIDCKGNHVDMHTYIHNHMFTVAITSIFCTRPVREREKEKDRERHGEGVSIILAHFFAIHTRRLFEMGSLPLLHLSIAGSVPQDFQALERQSEQEADDGCSPAQRLSLHETVGENRNLFFTFNKCDQDAMPDSPFVGVRMMGPDGQATWKNPMFLHFVWIGSPVTFDHPHLTASHLPHVNLGIMSI